MMRITRACVTLFIVSLSSFSLMAQNDFFTGISENTIRNNNAKRIIIPEKYSTLSLDVRAFRNFLSSLPLETSLQNRNLAPVIELPMPDGNKAKFRVWESPVMEPGLAARYPEIKTFGGQGIDDPYATIRMDFNPYFGFSAQILSAKGNIYIDPYAKGDINNYVSYYSRDYKRNVRFVCEIPEETPGSIPDVMARTAAGACRGTELYTYRLAMACTGEYAAAVCFPSPPTVPATLAAITTSVNRVDGVYESDLDIRLLLISNTDLLIYLDGTTDPYTNNSGGTMLGQNQTNIDSVIGPDNYDLGHVFSTGGGGVAGLSVVCANGVKARGVTGSSNPIGDNFDIDFVAHEMGHQFGASHTFNSTTGNCSGNRSSQSAFEVGSATTIMGYAGICDFNDIQDHSDPFFHARSFDQISNFLESGGFCRGIINTGNELPVIISMDNNNVNIPTGTPFTLTGSATDANGDAITYCWEEWDLGSSTDWNGGAATASSPLFKSRVPKTTGSRTFPDMAVILAGYPGNPPANMGGLKGETLPIVGRVMKFRLTVRDNRAGGGGITSGGEGCQAGFSGTFQVNTIDGTGPFIVTTPNGGENYSGNSTQTITWNVAGTDASPISCSNVKISLSTDGGLTYPNVLITSTANDGSEILTIPDLPTSFARVKVEAVGNIFFDISDGNFTITAAPTGFSFDNPAPATVACAGPVSASITLGITSIGGYNIPVNLSATGVPVGTNVSFSVNPVTPGGSTPVTLNNINILPFGSYNITVIGASGAIVKTKVLTYTIQPGAGPSITTQPASQQVCTGSNVTFIAASGSALGYQWQLSTDGGANYSNIAGATSSTYTVFGVTVGQNNYRYRAVVSGQCSTTNSNAAILTVLTPPAITSQPQNATICTGGGTTFNVAATGGSLSYQWQLSTNGGASFNDVGGANASGYTISNVSIGMNDYQYRVIVTGGCMPPATSASAVLTVISPVDVTLHPAAVTICETGNAGFTVAGSGSGILYQWQVSTNGGASYTDISGANTATLNLSSVTASMHNNLYRALLSNTTCTVPTASNPALLNVTTRPSVSLAAAPYTKLFPGLTTTITATTVPATGLVYTWFWNGIQIPGATSKTFVVPVTGLGDYRVSIIDPITGCNNQSSLLRISDSVTSRVFIFPSPNDGQFLVTYYNPGGVTTQQSVTVYDSRGAKVYHGIFDVSGAYQLHSVNIQPAQRGIYYVIVGDARGTRLAAGKVLVH